MSIHDLARTASADLRTHTGADVDASLDALLVRHGRRQRRSRTATALIAAAAVLAAWWGSASLIGRDAAPEPAPSPPSPSRPGCDTPTMTCLGGRTYSFALTRRVTWHIPHRFGVNSGQGATSLMVESYWSHHQNAAGVTVMEGVTAPARHFEATLPGGPTTAAGYVHWLAARPYLVASAPQQTTLDGHPAWTVRVRRAPGTGQGPGRCTGAIGGIPCQPVTYQDVRTTTGIFSDMVADYTAFDLPGSGTTVVWSWAFSHDTVALQRNRRLVDGLSWPSD